jgi:hypothetical protein
MTKAADPVAGPRPFEGSRPAYLDRIPGWERTRLAVTGGDSADSVDVRLSGVVLLAEGEAGARLDRRRTLAKPRHADIRGSARRRHVTDICGAGGGQDAKGRASTQRRSRNSGAQGCDRNEGLVAIHLAHPLPSKCRRLTEEHKKKPKDPGRAGQLLFLGNFCGLMARSPCGMARSPCGRPRAGGPVPAGPCRRARAKPPQLAVRTRPSQLAVRTRPSCTTDTTSSPSSVKTWPRASPRAPAAVGDSWSYRSHRSARNGRWNHIA